MTEENWIESKKKAMKRNERATIKAEKICSYLGQVWTAAGKDPGWIEKTSKEIWDAIMIFEMKENEK